MPYTAEVTRTNPTCVLFMIDQSRSMRDEIRADEGTQPKANGVAATVNRWLLELSLKCAKAEGVGDYYHVGVIGYGKKVGPALGGKNAKKRAIVAVARKLAVLMHVLWSRGEVYEPFPQGANGAKTMATIR